jgi:hypothetical protein
MQPDPLPGVSRTTAEQLAQTLAAMYADAERRLVEQIAHQLAAGMDRPQWADEKLAALATLRQWIRTLLLRLGRDTRGEVTRTILAAYAAGGTEALRALAAAQNTLPEWVATAEIEPGPQITALLAARNAALAGELTRLTDAFPGLAAVQRLAAELTTRIAATHVPILRWAEDTYRAAVAAGSAQTLLGTATRRQATQAALDRLVTDGVTGFTDTRGRRWTLASYVEMATRTAVAHAAINGHLDRLTDNGRDLVIVSNAPQECELCRPWEGKVLAITGGPSGPVERRHATKGTAFTVHIAGTVAEATAAGLFHPNCRHSLSIYLPGVTRIPQDTADPEGDAARQQLRYLERGVRAWRLREAGALDKAAALRAKAKAAQWQARIRAHIAASEHLGIMRKPERERINLGHNIGRPS